MTGFNYKLCGDGEIELASKAIPLKLSTGLFCLFPLRGSVEIVKQTKTFPPISN